MAYLLVCDRIPNYTRFLRTELRVPPGLARERARSFVSSALQSILFEFQIERPDLDVVDESTYFVGSDKFCTHKESLLKFVHYGPFTSEVQKIAQTLNDHIVSALRQFVTPDLGGKR